MTMKDAIEKAHEQEAMERAHLRGEVTKLKRILKEFYKRADYCLLCLADKDEPHETNCEVYLVIKD